MDKFAIQLQICPVKTDTVNGIYFVLFEQEDRMPYIIITKFVMVVERIPLEGNAISTITSFTLI